jgi:hypothetical protein
LEGDNEVEITSGEELRDITGMDNTDIVNALIAGVVLSILTLPPR